MKLKRHSVKHFLETVLDEKYERCGTPLLNDGMLLPIIGLNKFGLSVGMELEVVLEEETDLTRQQVETSNIFTLVDYDDFCIKLEKTLSE